jgi:hypothetical protein
MNTTSTRRPATAADIKVGAIVHKGQGKATYRITEIRADFNMARVARISATGVEAKSGGLYRFTDFTVEA